MGKKERSSTPLFLLCSLLSSARTQSSFPDKPVPSGLHTNLHIHLRLRRSRATGARWSVFGVLPETDSNLECGGHWPPRNVPFVLYRKRALLQVILEFVFPRGGGVWELEFRLQDPPLSYAPWNAPLGTKGAAPSTQECRLEAGATKKTRKCALGAAWNAPDFFGAPLRFKARALLAPGGAQENEGGGTQECRLDDGATKDPSSARWA